MIRTIALLITTIIILPVVAVKFAPVPLNAVQIDMLETSAFIVAGVALACFILAETTRNCSQVDKIWSIVPMVYVWYFAAASDWSPRLLLMAFCVTFWGVRLTYNFSRRGGYRLKFWLGEEDYRWEMVRQNALFKNKPVRWFLFDLFFISIYQNALLWLITIPAMMAYAGADKPLGGTDWLLAFIFIVLVVTETTADQQQWNYQKQKKRKKELGESLTGEYAAGFISSGLWGKIRHPNYACEQAIWITFYFFSVVATGKWINWSMAGCLLLMVLFQGSADFSEQISASKYPLYKDYQKRVGKFLPKIF
jgi:steroid 5-alpha reductase family enzyme